MRITEADKKFLKADIEVLKAPELDSPPAQRLPEVIETVSKMLSEIEKNGIDAVKKYSRDLDKWDKDFELSTADLAKTGDRNYSWCCVGPEVHPNRARWCLLACR